MGDFKEHGLMLFLGPELYLAFITFQADKKLGRSYAGLSIFNEGAFRLGLISEEQYETNKKRYSRGLTEQLDKPLTFDQLNEKKERDKWAKTFSMVLEQWPQHPDLEWREGWFRKAEEWKNQVPNAKLVLELKNGVETDGK